MIDVICPVRNCRLSLVRGDRQWRCPTGHSFDVAKSGYCNLLQPNERRSKNPGDSPDIAQARRRLLDRGIGIGFIDAVLGIVAELGITGPILDAGCGEGLHLSRVCERTGAEGVGIDISIPSIDLAARRYRERAWIVSNIDRNIPLADRSVGSILSITSRVNRVEFARILRPGGFLIVVTPGPDDLAELRERVLGDRTELVRAPDISPVADDLFDSVRQLESREMIEADGETILDLLLSTYRGQRRSQSGAATALRCLTVTQSRSIAVYSSRGNAP